MKKIWIEPGCITCGACEFICPELFKVTDRSYLKEDGEFNINTNKELYSCAKMAEMACPVQVIKIEE